MRKADFACEGAPGRAARRARPEAKASQLPLTPEQKDLVERHLGLVRLHLRKRVQTPPHPTRGREYDDLYQEGCVALLRAAGRYRPGRHGQFPAFALPRIRGAVYAALHEQFSLIHVPLRRAAARQSPDARPPGQRPVQILDPNTVLESRETSPRPRHELLRELVHRRFRRAVRRALAELQTRRWRHRNPFPIMARVAAERLLIPAESHRTPLRQIAREAGVSSGRAADYERQLLEAVRRQLTADRRLPALLGCRRVRAGLEDLAEPASRNWFREQRVRRVVDSICGATPDARAAAISELVADQEAVAALARRLERLFAADEAPVGKSAACR